MEFQTLKKSYKKQIVIGALAVCVIGGALTFATTRAKYKLTQDIPLVRGTVNYKMPDLRIVAINTSEDGTNYTETNTVPTSGYQLNTTKSICKIAATDTKDEEITIEYKEGKVNILGVTKKGTKCYLYFDKYVSPIAISDIIASISPKDTTPTFTNAAITDEGVYKVSDGMYGGTSYYWRGAVTNNYVKFAGKCWRIIRINGDGSMRLIYDGATCHVNGTNTAESIAVASTAFNTNRDQSNYVGWTYSTEQRPSTANPQTGGIASNAKTQLESWYNSNIGNNTAYSTKVADGKYCNDRNVQSGSNWSAAGSSFNYAAYNRINTGAPTLSCSNGDIYSLKVGLITADEVMYAGGKIENNTSYYLYNGQNYWTMSPYHWNDISIYARVFLVNSNGYLDLHNVNNTFSLRPVINLKADTQFQAGGNGTQSNPYVVV